MKTLNLVTFASVFQRQEKDVIREAHRELITALDKAFDVNIVLTAEHDSFLKADHAGELTVVFISTGGTEGMVVKAYEQLPHPLTLLTDGKANSLAASLELACWTRQNGHPCRLIHASADDTVRQLLAISECNVEETSVTDTHMQSISLNAHPEMLKGERIGVVGVPSDWLVASGIDRQAVKERWGAEVVDIPLSEVEAYYAADAEEDTNAVDAFINNASDMVEPSREDVVKALRLYRALKAVVQNHKLTALTLQCFSLIPTTGTTGCLALAMLNDEGIIAGCEGDEQTLFSLLLAKRLTGVDGFMANPSLIDNAKCQITLAHCTIGLRQTRSYIIRSHFESLSGVAIQGILPEGDITIFKCGERDLSRAIVLKGRIVENQNDPQKCRTQLFIELDASTPTDYFLRENIGNHHVILQGDYSEKLVDSLK